jgi:archaellum component FlaC
MMEVEEQKIMRTISEDVKNLKDKVEGMEGMLETLVEIYTDAFYTVKEEYLEKLENIRKERGRVFSSIEEFDRYFE